jgi:hypothetical protein
MVSQHLVTLLVKRESKTLELPYPEEGDDW